MKKLMLIVGLFLNTGLNAQEYVNQVLILNEGYFDYSSGEIVEPVTVGVYDPSNESYQDVAVLDDMRFASDLIIDGAYYYVAADTKIFKMDLNTHELIATANCAGVRKLAISNERLFATRGEYLVTFDSYINVFSINDLSLEAAIDTTSGPKYATQNLIVDGENVYVAVNNGFEYLNEKGFVGVLNAQTLVYENEVDLGPDGINPDNMIQHNGEIYTINNKDWSGASVSRVSLDLSTTETVNIANASTNCGTSSMRDDKLIYQLSMQSDLQEFDFVVMNNAGPVNGSFTNFYALNQNPVDGNFYASETDYFSFGRVYIYNDLNEEISMFETSVTPGTISFDIRTTSGLAEHIQDRPLVMPNPSSDFIQFSGFSTDEITITNAIGTTLIKTSSPSMDASSFPSGIYYATQGNKTARFIKE